MHRHGYKGTKFHRERDQRRALMKGLADSLVKYESIETTLPKAKAVVPYLEKLITKAKKGDLHSRRQVISKLQTIESAHKLVDDIAPKLNSRDSGHLRVERTHTRRGDNAQLARVSFVDNLNEAPVAKAVTKPKAAAPTATKPAAKKAPAKKRSTAATAKGDK
jgi:large subunit ribosomal protein L17